MNKDTLHPIGVRFAALFAAMAGLGVADAAGEPLEDVLRQPVSIDLQDVHLVEVLEALETAGLNFAVDWRDVEPPEPAGRARTPAGCVRLRRPGRDDESGV